MVSYAGVEVPTTVPSPSATLAGFTHSSGCLKPSVPPSKSAPSLAVARSAPWCLAGSGGSASSGMPPAPRPASCEQAYTWSASAATRCGLEEEPWLPPVGATAVVSHSGRTGCGKETMVSHLAFVVMRSWSKPRASKLGGLARIKARSCRGPQRLGGAMHAAVQPVAAGDRPTAALRLLLAGP
jgi:hypothetical protein